MTRKTQIKQTNNMASASERNSLVGNLLGFLTTLVMLFSVGVSGAWAFNDFEIDLTKNPVGDLPAGVSQIGYPTNGAGFNGSQHGWQWYAIQFDVDGPVKITVGGCQYTNDGYEGYVTDGNGTKLADIHNKTAACYDADPVNNVGSYIYTGGAGKLKVYCGQYCPYIKVEKINNDFTIDLTKNPVGDLPAGVTQISYSTNGAGFNGSQHGWQWYAIQFDVAGPVKVTLGGCQYINDGYEGYVTDGSGTKLADIHNKTAACYDADSENNVGTYSYTGGAGTLKVYCGQYCPSVKVEPYDAPAVLPEYTVTFYDGETVLGSKQVTQGDKVGEITYSATVAADNKFRRWKDKNGKEVDANTVVNSDLSVYACVTKIETAPTGYESLSYDLTKATFYPDEHDILTFTNYRFNSGGHGEDFKSDATIDISVAGPTIITLGLCQHAKTTAKFVLKNGEELIGEVSAKDADCTHTAEFRYEGESSATLTLSLTADSDGDKQAYLHSILVAAIPPAPTKVESFELDFSAGGNAESIVNKWSKEGGSTVSGISFDGEGNPVENKVSPIISFNSYYKNSTYGITFTGGNFMSFPVDGPVTIVMGMTDYNSDVEILNENDEKVGELSLNSSDKYSSNNYLVTSFDYKGSATTLKLKAKSSQIYIPYIKVLPYVDKASRAFTDFKVDFRNKSGYVVKQPASLPTGVVINGSWHDDQHGYGTTTITVPVDGPTKFTFGACGYNSSNAVVKDENQQVLATIDCKGSCDDYTSTNNTVVWIYNSGKAQTLTITTGTYIPFFYAEKCDPVISCVVKYYDGDNVVATENYKGNGSLKVRGSDGVTVGAGQKFRSWKYQNGKRVENGTTLIGDLNLYACVTDVEEPTTSTTYDFNLGDANFYMDEHEAISAVDGSFHDAQHGWIFKKDGYFKIKVAGNATVTIPLCQYSGDGDVVALNPSGVEFDRCKAKVASDATTYTFNYEGEAGELTFKASDNNTYIHSVKVVNVGGLSAPTLEDDGYYHLVLPADAADNARALVYSMSYVAGQSNKKLYLPNGTYDLGTATLTPVPAGVTLKGESMNGVLIQNSPVKEVINNTATLLVAGDNITIEDLTLKCRAPYGTGDDTNTAERGLCIQDKGDNIVFRRVKLDGYQDTYWSQKAKVGNTSYFYDCVIMGNVDFICGSGNVWFENCKLQIVPCHSDAQGTVSSGTPYIVAPSTAEGEKGYIFNNCTIENATSTNMDGKFYLGRGWQNNPKASFFNTTMKINPIPVAFLNKMSASNPDLPCVWQEMGSVTASGTAVDVSSRPSNTVIDVKTTPEAKPLPSVKAEVVGSQLKWTAISGAVAYNIYKESVFVEKMDVASAASAKSVMRVLAAPASGDISYDLPYGDDGENWSVRAINSYGVVGLTVEEDDPFVVEFSDEAKVIDKTNKPFGFVTATDRTSPTSIDLSKITGGGALTIEEALAKAVANADGVVTLQSDGVTAMDAQIKDAIANKSIIIFDGGNTETTKKFIVSEVMQIKNLKDKTIIGINGARLCTEFFITERYKYLLDNAGVKGASTASGTGGTFKYKNGNEVTINEQEEYLTRLTLYNAVEDAWEKKAKAENGGVLPDNFEYKNSEPYINAGIFYFDNCNNFVIRNLKLEGPGSVDVGGTDLMSIINGSHHFWVDHCEFTDGIDGNFDITNGSDFVTVSWCKFSYTERAYAHENSNLVGSDDSKDAMDTNHLNITYAYNEWGKGCDGRMPMARFGKIHMLNNYYTCDGNTQNAMNPRKNSEFLVEGNLFTKGVTKTYKEDGALAVTWGAGNTIKATSGVAGTNKGTQPVTVPYDYKNLVLDVVKLPEVLELNGGAVLGTSPVFTTDLTFDNQAYETTPAKAAEGLTFSVWAENAHTFQWYKKQNGDTEWTKIPDASRNSYTYISNKVEKLQLMCRAYGVSGTADSKTLILTIKDGDPAFITNLNANYTLYGDKDLTLEVDASNLCTYQWYKCDDTSKTNAQAIDGATKRTYSVAKATEAGNSYYYCVATYTPAAGDHVVLTSNVATLTAELNDGRKLWVYGYYDQSASEGKGDSFIKNAVGTSNAVTSTCTGNKCTESVNSTWYKDKTTRVSGYVFVPCDTHYNNPKAYVEVETNSALVSTDKIRIRVHQGDASSSDNKIGFYLCTEQTKSDASLVETIAIPTKVDLSIHEVTLNVADYFEQLVGKTKLYLLPFSDKGGRKVNLNEVLVLTYPAGAPVIITDIENAEYETPKGESIELSVKASNVKGYQWYKCTDSDKSGETVIDGATSANYTFSSKTDGTYYVFCRAEGLKADTHADSRVAKIVVTKGKKVAVFSYVGKDNGSGSYAEDLTGGTYTTNVETCDGTAKCVIAQNNCGDESGNKVWGLKCSTANETGHKTFHGYIEISLESALQAGDMLKFGTNTSGTSNPNSKYGFIVSDKIISEVSYTKIANSATTSGKNLYEEVIEVPSYLVGKSKIYLIPFVPDKNKNINLHELTITRFQLPEAPAFTTNLATEYNDAIVGIKKTLTVAATGAESYQWYKNSSNTTEGAAAIDGATAASYDFTATEAGDTYIYCVATNESGSTTSNIAKVHAAKAATIITNLEEEYTTTRGTNVPLTVEVQNATSYQWYSNTKNSEDGATEIDGATEATYTFPATNLLTRYIYCIAKDASEGTAKTNIAKVTVNPAADEENTETLTVQSWATPLEGDVVENAEAGTVDVNGKKYVAGDEIKMTATPAHGYKFDHWADNSGNTVESATVTIPEGGVTYRAYFTKLEEYALTLVSRFNNAEVAGDNPNVWISSDDTHATHPADEKIKLTANAKPGYFFVKWTSDDAGETTLSTDNPYTYTTTDVAKTIYAQFDSQYIVEFSKGSVECVGSVPKNAYFDASGSQFTLPKNTSLYKEGYTLTGWKLQGSDTEVIMAPGETYTVTNKSGNVFEPVFTQNNVDWEAERDAITITWSTADFKAANISYQGNAGYYVKQIQIGGKDIDIPLIINTTADGAKFAPNGNGQWFATNAGTVIIIPSIAISGEKTLPGLKRAVLETQLHETQFKVSVNDEVTDNQAKAVNISYKNKTVNPIIITATEGDGYIGDIKLSIPAVTSGGKSDVSIYSTSFTEWTAMSKKSEGANVMVKTKTKENLTFTLVGTAVYPATAYDPKFNADGRPDGMGYIRTEADNAYIVTSKLNNITKVTWRQGATSSKRGLILYKSTDDGVNWTEVGRNQGQAVDCSYDINEDNVMLKWEYYEESGKNAFMLDLNIFAKMVLTQCEDPEYTKGDWIPEEDKWAYTVTAGLPEDAVVHYCEVSNEGDEGAEQTGGEEITLHIAPNAKYKVWTVDSYSELPISNKVVITGDAMQKTVAPILSVDPYSITGKTHKVTVCGLADGAKAYYTVKDGEGNVVSGPTEYTGEFTITPGQTVEVYASLTHYANSDVVSRATTTITLPQKETFKTLGPGKADIEVAGIDNVLNPATIEGKYISGINGDTGLKYTINNTVGKIGDKDVKGIEIKVHDGYVINHVDVEGAYSNDSNDKTTSVKAIYVDGVKLEGFTQKDLPKYSSKQTIDFVIEGIEAKKSIVLEMDDNISQARANISVTYDFIDEPVSVAIKQNAGTAAVATINYSDFTDNAYTYGTTLDYIPVVEMTTKQGYVYTMQDKKVDGFDHTFKYTVMGKEYSVKTHVSVLSSPGITVDENHVSVAGGYPVTLSGAGTMYINIDNKKDESDNLVWEEYDPEKKYYAVKYVKSYCVYDKTSTIGEPSEYEVSKNVYDYTKPFAVYVRQPSYLDSQDGSNPYNSLAPEANDKIYQALQKNFNVVDFVKPSSTEVLKEMPDIAEAKLVVITEMISGSGSYQMQRPQDKEVLDTKSTALTMTLLRDVVDKTNVINFKMFTYSQSKNNTDRWGWAMPAALPSGIISINPVEPNGGGMYELFSEARMNVGGTITLWDNINEDKNLNHLQPVFNFAEGEHVPNFVPLALAVDPDNQEEEYHILHYYDKTTNDKKTTYVGFGLSVNEWTAYNDNLKAIIEKMGEMIIAGRPLNSKLDHIVDPNITDNGDGSATVMNNNFSATTYYLAKNKDEDAPDATTIETTGSQSLAENDYHTQKYTTDKILYVVSKLGTAYSNVVSAPIKGSVIRYINRVNDDPEATGLEARYPFEVNKDGSVKAFDFPYNQSWKKEGYTVTKWIDVNNGTEYIPGQSCSNLTGEITVKAVWTKNAHEITDLSKIEDKAQRTVTWEFLPSKGAPMIQIEEKNGKYPHNAILVGQAKFNDGTWIDVPLDIYANPTATTTPEGKAMPDGGKFVNRAFYDKKPGTYEKDYAQVRTGTQMKMPAVYGMLLKYHQMDMNKVDTTALHEKSQSYITQSYVTDGTTTGETQNKWVVRNPGLETNADGAIVLDGNKKPTIKLNNLDDGGEILYEGEGLVATLNTVESAVFTEHDDKNKEGRLNEGSCFMDKLEVTYPALYELTCTWIAVGNETNPNKSELDPEENPGKIEKLNDSHANCNGRYLLDYPVYLKLTPSYGYYVDVDNAEVKDDGGNVTTPAYFFFKNGKDATEALSGDDLHIYRYKDPGYAGYSDEIKAKIPVDGAYIEMNVRDIDLYVSMKKVTTRTYSITAYPGDMGVIEYNTGNGRTPENEYKQFPDGKTIVVTAAPKMGYKFKEWRLNPEEKNPTVGDQYIITGGIDGITFGTGTNVNPLVSGKNLEKNELAIVVNDVNASNDKKYYAIFEEGVEGTANYQFTNALEQYVEGGVVKTKPLELGDDAINAFPTSYKSTALNIPRYYTLYKEGYTLDHWVENTTPDEAQPTLGKTYDIGTFYYFDNKDENRYLIPVFTKDPVSYDHRAVPVDITWDFRSSKFAQRMNFNTKDDGGKYKTQSIFYSTHAVINNEHLMDVPLQITLGNKGKLQNNTDDEWCAIGEGTEIVIPSGIGAKFTIASLSPMTTTSFIEKDAFGNVVNSTVPTSYTRKNENDIDVYYYTFTTQSTSTNITLKIGDDYSYYKSIRAELPAADAVPLKVTVNNPAFGGSELKAAIHTDGTSHLDQIKKTYAALPESEGNGGVYTLGLGTTVTLHAKRNHLYVVDHFEDHFGTKYTWSNSNPGNIKAVSADGTDVSAAAKKSGMSMAKATDVLGANNDIEFTFQVNTYDNRMHIVYKENTLYQINYTSGEEAEGEAPGIKLIEEGESFTVPAENHYLYVDGQTLKYWVDEDGNKYDFGQSYIPGQHFTASKDLPSGFKSGEGFDVPLDNLFLTPHFDVNDFTVMNLTEEATAVWPLTRLGKSGSDDPNGNYPGNDDVVIYFQKSVGIYVTPLKLADGRFIDLKLDMNCAKTGKIDNQNNGERCQINGESTVSVPSSSNCDISLYTVNGKLSTTVIAGATAKEDGKEGDKVVATKYTSTTVSGSNDVATVTYTGSNTMVDIDFMGEAGYFYQIAATYKPVETKLPELDYVTIDNIALGALGTGLAEKKLFTLKTEGQVEGVVADLRTSKSGNMPVVKAQATNNGYVEITPATIDNPVATLLVKTRDGVTVSVHKIFFNVTPPVTAPIITDLRIGSQYQCDIEKIDGDAMFINNNWDDVYPEGSYIYGYKDKADGNTDKETDEYILNVKDAGINGAIAIRFNKPMKEANVKVEELGQTIHAEEGQTLVFSYWGLDLNTNYDFIIPANTLEDVYGNKYAHPIRINFTTVEHAVEVENRLINFVVTHNQSVKWDQETFSMVPDGAIQQVASDELIANLDAAGIAHGTISEGVKMANDAKSNNDRFYIFVPDGEYQLQGNTSIQANFASGTYAPADNTGKLRDELLYKSNGNRPVWNGITEIARGNVSITGQSQDKTIVWNRPEIEGISYTATFRLNNGTSNFYAQDMTWENRFDYKTSIGKQGAASAQAARAVVLQDRSSKSVFKNVNMMSYQDTYYSNPTGQNEDTRYYFENCTLGGYVDFLCGDGDVWLEKCDLVLRQGKGTNACNIMAPRQYPTQEWGYVFNRCNIKAEEDAYNINNGKFTLGRPWQNSPASSLLYTTYHVLPTTDAYKQMSETGKVLRMHEFRSYMPDGTLVDLSQRSLRNSSPGAGSYDAVMTPSEAERYTVFNAMGGNDGYDPTIYTRQVSMKNNNFGQDDTALSWDKEPEALCYFIFRKDNETDEEWKLFAVTEDTEFELDDRQLDKWFCVRAANQRGGLGEPTQAYQYKAHESYKRELIDNAQVIDGWRWSTIYLDFDAKAPVVQHQKMVDGVPAVDSSDKPVMEDEIYVYALVKVDATKLTFKRVKIMEKNCGYLIKARPRPEVYEFKYTEKTPVYHNDMTVAEYEQWRTDQSGEEVDMSHMSLMNGSVNDKTAAGTAGYTLASKVSYGLGFYKYVGKQYNANYAWIDAALVAEAQKAMADGSLDAAAKAGYMMMVFEDDSVDGDSNISTDLDGIREHESNDDNIYNLNGQRINASQMQRGQIYIINGKKIRK